MPIVITSLSAPTDIATRVHEYGGIVLHDVIKVRHAEKALEAGVDGIILVCAGAGGHAGTLNPFALVNEIRRMHEGPLVLAGAITNGAGVLAAQAMGCDAAYMGTRFIATKESLAVERYKQMLVESNAGDIVYTPFFSGVHGSYLAPQHPQRRARSRQPARRTRRRASTAAATSGRRRGRTSGARARAWATSTTCRPSRSWSTASNRNTTRRGGGSG